MRRIWLNIVLCPQAVTYYMSSVMQDVVHSSDVTKTVTPQFH